MPPLTPDAAFLDSEVKSLRRAIVDIFGTRVEGGRPILLARNDTVERPFWRIDSATALAPVQVAAGWEDSDRVYNLGYYGTDRTDVVRHAEILRGALGSAIPFRYYDVAWYPPHIEITPDPAGIAAGDYTFSATFISPSGEETLPSAPVVASLGVPSRVVLYVRAWPWRHPLAGSGRVYGAIAGGARTLLGQAPMPSVGGARVELTTVGGAITEPASSTVGVGALDIRGVSVAVMEDVQEDGMFNAAVIVTVGRPLHLPPEGGFRPYAEDEVIFTPYITT